MFMGGAPVTIIVDFDAHQARYARERSFHPTQQRQDLPGGGLRLTFETTEAALGQVARWLMQYGEHAVAVKPQQLRDLMRENLTSAAKHYIEAVDSHNDI